MPSLTEWKVPPANQPRSGDYAFDLDRVLASVVGLHSIIPSDAFSAETFIRSAIIAAEADAVLWNLPQRAAPSGLASEYRAGRVETA